MQQMTNNLIEHLLAKVSCQIVIRFGAFRRKCNVFRDYWFPGLQGSSSPGLAG